MIPIAVRVLLLSIILSAFGAMVKAQSKCQPKKHAKLPVIIGLTYHTGRKKLLALGWQPKQTISANEASTDINTAYGNGEIFWKKGYWEVEACSGTGLGHCSFLYTDAYGNILRVVTAGEEHIQRPRSYARIQFYKFVCEPND